MFGFQAFIARAVLICAVLALMACVAKKDSAVSSIQLELPDWQQTLQPGEKMISAKAMSAAAGTTPASPIRVERRLSRLMVNISGSGFNALVKVWEQNGSNYVPPTSLSFEVPRGNDRLIQVLAITRDFYLTEANQVVAELNETFLYGDALKSLLSSSESVELALSKVDISQGKQGTVAGRLLSSATDGPTGKVRMKFAPANGRPPMTVAETEIFGGWFEFFALEGIPFIYEFEDGTNLLPNFKLSSPGFSVTGSNRLQVLVPPGFWERNWSGSEMRSPFRGQTAFVGYFGAGAKSSHKVCYEQPASPRALNSSLFRAEVGSELIQWVGQKGTSLAPGEAGIVSGGSTDCAVSESFQPYENYLKLVSDRIVDGFGIAGFSGPFRSFQPTGANQPTFLAVSASDGNQLQLNWKFLPGAAGPNGSNKVSGVRAFVRKLTDAELEQKRNQDRPDYQADMGLACDVLTDGSQMNPVFVQVADIDFIQGAQTVESHSFDPMAVLNTSVSSADLSSGRMQVVICPYIKGGAGSANVRLLSSGVDFWQRWSGSSGDKNPSLGVEGSPINASVNGCQPVTIRHKVNGQNASVEAALEFKIFMSPAGSNLFSDPGCSSANLIAMQYPTGSTPHYLRTIPAQSSETTVYARSSSAQIVSLWLEPNSTSVNSVGGEIAFKKSEPPSKIQAKLNVRDYSMGAYHLVAGGCYPMTVALTNASGILTNDNARSVGFGSTTSTLGSFFSQDNCSGSNITGLEFSAAEAYKIVYFKPSAGTGVRSFTLQSTNSTALMTSSISFDTSDGQVKSLTIEPQVSDSESAYVAQSCLPLTVVPRAANGAYATLASDLAVQVSSDKLFYDEFCTTALSSPAVLSIPRHGNGSEVFWLKIDTSVASSVSTIATGQTTVTGQTREFALRPNALSVTFAPVGSSSPPDCYSVTVEAKRDSSTVASVEPMQLNYVGANAMVSLGSSICSQPTGSTSGAIPLPVDATPIATFYVKKMSQSASVNLKLFTSAVAFGAMPPFVDRYVSIP